MKLNLIITVGQIGSSLAQKWSSCSGWVLIRPDWSTIWPIKTQGSKLR